jgi:uncharacterized protein
MATTAAQRDIEGSGFGSGSGKFRQQGMPTLHDDQASGRLARFAPIWRICILAVLVFHGAPLAAQGGLTIPPPVGYVNDFANVISAEDQQRMEQVMDEVRAKSGGEIVVVTLPSLEGRNRDEVALQIGRDWRVGQKGDPGDPTRNTGVVILVVPSEREYRIETGLGTMSFLTAAEAGRIGRDYLVPNFQQGNYGEGLYQAVAAIAQIYADQFGFELTGVVAPQPTGGQGREGPPSRVVIFILLLILLFMIAGRRGGGGPRS